MNRVRFGLIILLASLLFICLGVKCPWNKDNDDNDIVITGSSGEDTINSNTWTNITMTGTPISRAGHSAVWTGTPAEGGTGEMLIWGGVDDINDFNDGALYSPGSDSWSPMNILNAPSARVDYGIVWTGTEMIIWGGERPIQKNDPDPTYTPYGDGARYNPSLNQWTLITTTGAPITRSDLTAVWTGTPAEGGTGEMIVWGGYNGTYLNTGAKYNPVLDTWTPITITDAPNGRCYHTAVWTGTPAEGGTGEMIIWGGDDTNTGAKYNPISDTWATITTNNAPSARYSHSAVWTGEEMIIWGGWDAWTGYVLNSGGKYNPISNTWTSITTTNTPSAREEHSAIWTDSEMIIWGGYNPDDYPVLTLYFNTGAKYNPATDTWTSMSNSPLSPRTGHSAVWTGTEIIIWGGADDDVCFNDGSRYKP